jgi:hypothetical protein
MFWFNVAEYVFGLVKLFDFLSWINFDLVFGLVLISFKRNGLVCNVRLTKFCRKQVYTKNTGYSVKTQLYYLKHQLHVSAIVFAAIVRPIPRI